MPVAKAAEAKAIAELDQQPLIELTDDQVESYLGFRKLTLPPMRAILVRGVAYEGDPLVDYRSMWCQVGTLITSIGVSPKRPF